MFDTFKIPPFYTRYRKLKAVQQKAQRYGQTIENLLTRTQRDQAMRLATLRKLAPWDAEWTLIRHQYEEQTRQTLKDLADYWEIVNELKVIEARLTPSTAWQRLWCMDQWVYTGCVWGLAIAALILL